MASKIHIQSVDVVPVTFPLKEAFVTAAGQKTETHNVQVALHLSNGITGYAEASSSIAMPGESQANMTRVLKSMGPELRGKDIEDYKGLVALCWRLQAFHPTAAAAMECAILDAYTRVKKQPLAKFFGGKLRAVETDITLSVGEPEMVEAQAKAAYAKGFRRFKVKLKGDAIDKDVARILAVHRSVKAAAIVADGNQGLTLSQALEVVRLSERAGAKLAFLEQPFRKHDVRSMRLFKARSRMTLFADESVLTASDAVRLFEANAADGVNVKVAKSGLLGALDIVRIAQRLGKRLAIGCMEESKLGLAASVHLACGTGAFEWVDLDSVFLIETASQRQRGGFLIKGPKLSVAGVGPGIGI
jgi:L-alanine-DL-glutamate epimerase-like enolase superfamily enzyme